MDFILNAQSQSTVYISKHLLGDRFVEVNFQLSNKVDLDSTDSNTIEELLNEAITKFQNTYKINENIEEKFFK